MAFSTAVWILRLSVNSAVPNPFSMLFWAQKHHITDNNNQTHSEESDGIERNDSELFWSNCVKHKVLEWLKCNQSVSDKITVNWVIMIQMKQTVSDRIKRNVTEMYLNLKDSNESNCTGKNDHESNWIIFNFNKKKSYRMKLKHFIQTELNRMKLNQTKSDEFKWFRLY